MNKKIITILSLILCLSIIFYIYINKTKILSCLNRTKTNTAQKYEISLIQDDDNLADFTKEFNIDVKSNTKVDCKIKFSNRSGKDNIFLLKLNLNYLDANFCLDDSTQTIDSYKFELKNGEERLFNAKLDSNLFKYNLNPLVATVVVGPDKHASDINFISDSFSISGRYDLINRNISLNNSLYPQSEEVSNSNRIRSTEENNSIKVFINDNVDDLSNFTCPPVKLDVKPGQDIELGLRAGNIPETSEYIVWLNVNHIRQLINDKPYWHFKIKESEIAFKKLKFQAPTEKGKYELYAYMAPNPWVSIKNKSLLNMYIKTSFRLTINVE